MRWLGAFLLLWQTGAACAAAPAPFQLVAGDLPPFSQSDTKHPGALVELAEILAQKLGQPQKAEFFPWARALAVCENQERILILPLTRTHERETKFTWLAKMSVQHFVLISRSNQVPQLHTVDDLKGKQIAVLRGSPTLSFLQKQQVPARQITIEAKNELLLKALDHGLVDAIFGSAEINRQVIRKSGRSLAHYHFGPTLTQGDIWLAGCKGFSQEDQHTFRQAWETLQKDGTAAKILKKYELTE